MRTLQHWILAAAVGSLLLGCTSPTSEVELVATPVPGGDIDSVPTLTMQEPAETFDLGGRTLLVGTDATYPPFESTTEDDTIVGIDPSLMAAMCEIANCVEQFQHTSWEGIFPALAGGDFDVLMSAITILPEREADSGATFTEPYFEVGQVILARADGPVTAMSDLSTAKVGVQTGTTGDTAATDTAGVPDENMLRFETIVLAVEALLNGDVDAIVLDDPTAGIFVAQHSDALVVLGDPFTTEQYGILVPNTSPEVLAALNEAIRQLRESGRIDAIVSEWYSKEQASSDEG